MPVPINSPLQLIIRSLFHLPSHAKIAAINGKRALMRFHKILVASHKPYAPASSLPTSFATC